MKAVKFWRLFNIITPIIIWGFLLYMPYVWGFNNLPKPIREAHLKQLLIINLLLIAIFYLHSYVIYPLRERKHGLWLYFVLLIACLMIYLAVGELTKSAFAKPPQFEQLNAEEKQAQTNDFRPQPNPIIQLFPFAFIIVISFCHQLYLAKVKQEKLIKERENNFLQTELDFLSSQISPHFMFNTLNTLVAMARKKSDDLETSLISLSQLMRYMLYDHGQSILLATEIDYLKNYIKLQMLRFKDDVKVNLHLKGNFEQYVIAPMLLIPFIENAFKHGIGNIDQPTISISIKLDETRQQLTLVVLNQIAKTIIHTEKSSGIGLNNVKRRLQLLYPQHHLFKTIQKDDTFMAMLEINLS